LPALGDESRVPGSYAFLCQLPVMLACQKRETIKAAGAVRVLLTADAAAVTVGGAVRVL
jgi:hypothetical protein